MARMILKNDEEGDAEEKDNEDVKEEDKKDQG